MFFFGSMRTKNRVMRRRDHGSAVETWRRRETSDPAQHAPKLIGMPVRRIERTNAAGTLADHGAAVTIGTQLHVLANFRQDFIRDEIGVAVIDRVVFDRAHRLPVRSGARLHGKTLIITGIFFCAVRLSSVSSRR